MKTLLTKAKDPEIFRYIHALDTSRTLPAMDTGDGRICYTHENVSNLIAEQQAPVPETEWVGDNGYL